MRTISYLRIHAAVLAWPVLTMSTVPCFAEDARNLAVHSGIVKFTAVTNLSAISVHGQATTLSATAAIRKTDKGSEISGVHAMIDPKSLSTGMSLRDHHMRQRVFATTASELPQLEFTSNTINCPELTEGKDVPCDASGTMKVRGVDRPFTWPLKIRFDGKAYRVNGDTTVKLSAFGIEPPCQLGVCVSDGVQVRIEFLANNNGVLRAGGPQ